MASYVVGINLVCDPPPGESVGLVAGKHLIVKRGSRDHAITGIDVVTTPTENTLDFGNGVNVCISVNRGMPPVLDVSLGRDAPGDEWTNVLDTLHPLWVLSDINVAESVEPLCEQILPQSDKSMNVHSVVLDRLSSIVTKESLSNVDLEFLRTEALVYLGSILSSSSQTPSNVKDSVALFKKFIDVCVKLLKLYAEPEVEVYIILYRIFNGDRKFKIFYTIHGISKSEIATIEEKYVSEDGNASHNERHSKHLIELVEYFGIQGGFTCIYDRMSGSAKDSEFPFPTIRQICNLLDVLRPIATLLEPRFAELYVEKLCQLIKQHINAMNDEHMKELDKSTSQELVKAVDRLLTRAVGDTSETAAITETLDLNLSLKMLSCPYLSQRIAGLSRILDVLDMISNRSIRQAKPGIAMKVFGFNLNLGGDSEMSVSQSAALPRTKFLTEPLFATWLASHNSVESLLQQDAHPELLRRLPKLLRFMTRQGILKDKHFELLWECAKGKHETTVRAVYDVVSQLAADMTVEMVTVVYNHIKAIPFGNYTYFVMEFVVAFCTTANLNPNVSKLKKRKWYGLTIFWQFIQDDLAACPDLYKLAYNALHKQLSHPNASLTRVEYVEMCIDNLTKSYSVPQSLQLAIELLLLETRPKKLTKLIEKLLKDFDILKLWLSDFHAYMSQARDYQLNSGLLNGDDMCFNGFFDHGNHVSIRLEFLKVVLSNCELVIDRDIAEGLFDLLVLSPVSSNDQSRYFKWICQARTCDSSNYSMLSVESTDYIFKEILCIKVHPELACPEAYHCFETYFRHENQELQRIHNAFQDPVLVVRAWPLLGVAALWGYATASKPVESLQSARRFLIRLHLSLDPSIDARIHWRSFVETCIFNIKNASDAVALATLDMLLDFVDSCEYGRVKSEVEPTDTILSDIDFSVTFQTRRWDHGRRTLTSKQLRSGDQVSSIRERVASSLGVAENYLRIDFKGKHLVVSNDSLTLGELGVVSNDVFNILVLKTPEAADAMEWDELNAYPSTILAHDDDNFSVLSSALRRGGTIGEKVWVLLTRLPTNTTIQTSIAMLSESPDWEMLFDSSSLPNLLYSLLILERLIMFDGDVSGSIDDARLAQVFSYCTGFLEKGGLKHLLCILSGIIDPSVFTETLSLSALNHLLSIITYILVDLVDYGFSSRFVESTDSKVLIPQLFFVISQCSASTLVTDLQSTVVQSCFILLEFVLSTSVESLDEIWGTPAFKDILLLGVLNNPSGILRSTLCNAIIHLAQASHELLPTGVQSPTSKVLSVLLDQLWTIDSSSVSSLEYFSLVTDLLALQVIIPESGELLYQSDIILRLVEQIRLHPTLEQTSNDDDQVLTGLLNLMAVLLRAHPKESVLKLNGTDVILNHCLFDEPEPENRELVHPPKCKSSPSREAAFSVIEELAARSESIFSYVIKQLMPHHEPGFTSGPGVNEFKFVPEVSTKSSVGYVGLKNLGCTCYINSLLQQMFMIPQLRMRLLEIEHTDDESEGDFLFQLQLIFAELQESTQKFIDTKQFAFAFKDFDGSPTDPGVQRDGNEFLNMLFDRIDTKLASTQYAKVLSESLGGVLNNQVVCKGCPHVSERLEPYYCITLDVKNKTTVQSSLESFIHGEMLEGDNAYYCGTCDKKVDALKRSVIKDLPSTLVLHLKRFELDYETFQLAKLNDRLEFPMVLDMYPYTQEGVTPAEYVEGGHVDEELSCPTPEYLFQLSGILVHSGTANGGHYYSYVKERDGLERWIEFNDMEVSQFDHNLIEDCTFGGFGEDTENLGASKEAFEKRQNAYMLFYERVEHTIRPEVTQPPPLLRRVTRKRVDLPSEIFDIVWKDNLCFIRNQLVYDQVYHNFIYSMMSRIELDTSQTTLRLAVEFSVKHIFHTLARCQHKKKLLKCWASWLPKCIEKCPTGATWLIESSSNPNCSWLLDVLLSAKSTSTRELACLAYCSAVRTHPSTLFKFADRLLRLLDNYVPSTCNEAFVVLSCLARATPASTDYFIRTGLLSKTIDLYLHDNSPNPEAGFFVDGKTRPNFPSEQDGILDFISILVCSCETNNGLSGISGTDRELVYSKVFISRLVHDLSSKKTGESGCLAIAHLCWENMEFTAIVVDVCIEGILTFDFQELRSYFRVLLCLCKISDAIQPQRCSLVLENTLETFCRMKKYWKATQISLEFLIRFSKYCPEVLQWMHLHPEKFAWAIEWLSLNPNPPSGTLRSTNVVLLKSSKTSPRSGPYRPYSYGMSIETILQSLLQISEGGSPVEDLYLRYEDSDIELDERLFEVGLVIDCKDQFGKWHVAKILEVHSDTVLVSFDGSLSVVSFVNRVLGWPSKWNETLPSSSPNIALPGEHTSKSPRVPAYQQ